MQFIIVLMPSVSLEAIVTCISSLTLFGKYNFCLQFFMSIKNFEGEVRLNRQYMYSARN